MRSQVKAKERVRNFGEVFTAEREVNAMLDLVKNEASNIDSTFLEPACGDGNFLIEIWRRKLKTVYSLSGDNDADCEYWATRAISTIYGFDIQGDNVYEARERLYDHFFAAFVNRYHHKPSKIFTDSIRFILSQNIQCADSLACKTGNGEPLFITKWSFIGPTGLVVSIFNYEDMVRSGSSCKPVYTLPQIPYVLLPAIIHPNHSI